MDQQKVKGLTFEQWKARVERVLEKFFGVSSEGIRDYGYADAWQRGVDPGVAARRAVKAAELS